MSEADGADLSLILPARPENVAVVRQAMAGLAESAGAEGELIGDIKTAVTEACMNVAVHAYGDEPGPLEVTAMASTGQLTVFIRDKGVGIKPSPLEPDAASLRLGLPLIGALSDQFEISGGAGRGTSVKIVFDIARGERNTDGPHEYEAPREETWLEVRGPGGGTATARVIAMLAARANFSVDRMSDVQILADALAAAAPLGEPMRIAISEPDGGLEVRIGPLEPKAGRQMLERAQLPQIGSVIERVSDAVRVEPAEDHRPGEYLVLRLTSAG